MTDPQTEKAESDDDFDAGETGAERRSRDGSNDEGARK
jgi:hypothetical protein